MKKLSIVLIAGLISVNAFASMDFYTASEPRQITKASDVVVLTGVDAENLYQIIPGPEHPSLRPRPPSPAVSLRGCWARSTAMVPR